MPSARTLSAVVERFVERRRSDPQVTPDLFAVEIGGTFSDDERRALEACVAAEALLAEQAAQQTGLPETRVPDVLEGTTVGDFHLLRPIGRGGSGVVYLSEQLSLGRPAAVKVLHPACASSPAWRERFLREAGALARMNHPNIVPVLAAGEQGGLLYLAMLLVEGSGLDRHIDRATAAARCAFDAIETARVGLALADALHHAHECGLVHRDIKPSNILVTRSKHPYIVDFGLARFDDASRLTRTGEAVGTPLYMAPEQLDPSLGEVDARTDVFGLGLSLLEAATGWTPSIVGSQRSASPDGASRRLPRDLGTVLLRAIDPDPARRYPNAAALRDDLQRYLADAPVQARRAGVLLRSSRWARRHPAKAAAAVVVLLSTLGMAAWSWERAQTRRSEVNRLVVDASLSLERGDLQRAQREVAGLRERGAEVTDLTTRIDHLERQKHADHALDTARAGVFDLRANARDLARTRDACDEAMRFYTGREAFEPLVLKTIALFRLKQLLAARATGLAAAAAHGIPLEGEVLEELDALGKRLALTSMGGDIVSNVRAGEALATITDDKFARLRAFVVEHANDSPELVLVAGFLLAVAGRHGEALDLYDRVLDLNPRQPLALVAKATCCLEAGDLRAARDAARTAVTVAPDRASSHWVLARVQWRLVQPREALRSVEAGIALADGSLSPWLLKAEILASLGRPDEALAALETAAKIDPEGGLPAIERADLLAAMQRWSDALDSYRAAVGKPDVIDGHARAGEGKALFYLGRHTEAREALAAAIEENRALAYAWFWLAQVEFAVHDRDRCGDALLMAQRLVRRVGPAIKVEEYEAWHAELADEARERAQQSLRTDPIEHIESAIGAEVPDLKFDDCDLPRLIELAGRELEAGDAGAALARLEKAAARAANFARTPGPRLDRVALRTSLANMFDTALARLQEDERFERLRQADGFNALADAWRRQVAAWQRASAASKGR